MPTDSPKDTRLSPIVTSFRGHSFVIVSGSGRGRVCCWIALGSVFGRGWLAKARTLAGLSGRGFRAGRSGVGGSFGYRVGVRVAPYPLPT